MRILWVKNGALFPPDTGGRKRTWCMLREIVRAGHQVHYLALKSRRTNICDSEQTDSYAKRKTWVDHRETVKGGIPFFAELLGNLLFSKYPYVLDRYHSVAWREAIQQHSIDADVVVCDFLTPALNFHGLTLACPVILFQHNIESQIWKRLADTASHSLKRAYLASQYQRMWRAEKDLSQRFDGIITVSPEDSAFCRASYGLQRVLGDVPTGVDVEAFQPPSQLIDAPVVGFLGSMDWMPNIDGVQWFVRQVLPKVREQMPQIRLKIIGRNPPASIRSLAADPAIEVTGTVPDVQPHVHNCRLIVVPLLAGGGTRIKIFEAMAMGVPVISTTVGAEGLPVTHGSEIEIADGVEAFSAGSVKLLADTRRAVAMASRARLLMEQSYGWRSAAEKFIQLCGQVGSYQQSPS